MLCLYSNINYFFHMYKKTLLKFFLFLSLSSFFIFSNVSQAATTGTTVATVNIDSAKISSQEGNSFNVVFTISNKEGIQNGVFYGVQLVSKTNNQIIVDEKVFDDSMNMPENSNIQKAFSYQAPGVLSGKYQLFLIVKNKQDFPFAFYPLGDVSLTPFASGVVISPETCTLNDGLKTGAITQPVLLTSRSQKLTLSCSATNTGSSDVSMAPEVETKLYSAFGEKVQTAKIDSTSISFKPKEKKTFSVLIPLADKPQKYNIKFSLVSGAGSSNSVEAFYTLRGNTATISNLSLDKDYYKRGEIAALSIVWTSPMHKVLVEASLYNKLGMKCASPINQDLVSGQLEILMPVNTSCDNPSVSVTLKDTKGNVLDKKDFSVQSSSENRPDANIYLTLVLVLGALAIVVIYLKRNNMKNDTSISGTNSGVPMSAFLPIIILAGVLSLVPLNKASANTVVYYSGPGNSVQSTVTVSPYTYNPSNPINLSWNICNNYVTELPVSLDAINDIGLGGSNPSSTLKPASALPAGTCTGTLFDNTSFTTPSSQGIYNISFSTGVYTPDTQNPNLYVSNMSLATILTDLKINSVQPTLTGDGGGYPVPPGNARSGIITMGSVVPIHVEWYLASYNPGGNITVFDTNGANAGCTIQQVGDPDPTYDFSDVDLTGSWPLTIVIQDGEYCF